jgi:hypothetical protein
MTTPPEMLELRRKWLEALRSGNYHQGTGYLKREKNGGVIQYCCLGVLCEVAGLESKLAETRVGMHSFEGSRKFLPPSVMVKVGLVSAGGDSRKATTPSLSALNDSGYDFAYIARYIEDHAVELFVE